MFYQHYCQLIFEGLIEGKLKESFTDTAEEILPQLTLDEENAVRYVAGYVVRKVGDSLQLPKDQAKCDILYQLIETSANANSAGTSQEWTSRIDRGGLIHVTDEAFQCFYSIEYCIRRYLRHDKVNEMDSTFRDRVTNAILADDDVQFHWIMTGPMDDEVGKICLDMIVKKWVTIRGFSFASSILELHKQESKKGTGKSKGLRTKLFS